MRGGKAAACSGDDEWTAAEERLFRRLDSPHRIQEFLNRIAYDPVKGTRSPRWTLREGKANCFEGALFAAAALRHLGHPPRIMDLEASANDDDHILALFRHNGAWGCVAKSNYTVLRFREPVYRTLRELAMSFFDVFFNPIGEKTLRAYSVPLDLGRFDRERWMTTEEDLGPIGDALNAVRHFRVLTPRMLRDLTCADPDLVKAGLLGADPKGLFKPKRLKWLINPKRLD